MEGTQDHRHPMRWMWYGLAAMFVLIGVAAVLAVYYGGFATGSFNFDWVWNIIGLLFVVWIFSMVIGGMVGSRLPIPSALVSRR